MSESGPDAPAPAPTRYIIDHNTEIVLTRVAADISLLSTRIDVLQSQITRELDAMEKRIDYNHFQLQTQVNNRLAFLGETLRDHIDEKTKQLALAIHTHGK